MLKTIEEPAGPVVFVGVADFVPPELVTVASRSVRIDFRPLTEHEVRDTLVAEGVAPERAATVAELAGGRLDRARLLASDPGAEARRQAWEAVPARLDGSGAMVALLVDQLVDLLKRSVEPLTSRQDREMAAVAERSAQDMGSAPAKVAQAALRAGARPGGTAPPGAAPAAHRRASHRFSCAGPCLPRPGCRRRPPARPGGRGGGPHRPPVGGLRIQPGRTVGPAGPVRSPGPPVVELKTGA